MAQLVDCPLCKKTVSDEAESCPHCGHNVRAEIQRIRREEYERSPEGIAARQREEEETRKREEKDRRRSERRENGGACVECGRTLRRYSGNRTYYFCENSSCEDYDTWAYTQAERLLAMRGY